jgi:hypothetical protein
MRLRDRFRKWYQEANGPISIMNPCQESYIQGALDERRELAKKISECVTYEEIMQLISMELDSAEQKGE